MGVAVSFQFAAPARIVFGAGALQEAGPRAAELGRRALVVTGATTSRAQPLLDLLAAHEVDAVPFAVSGEPTLDIVREGAAAARHGNCDLVIGFGGGSPLDTAKAVVALAANEGDPLDYVEVIGRGRALTQAPLPFIAIPTTAGTGSEATHNSVIASPEHRVKVSLRSPLLFARLALVDPELTHTVPPDVTAATGLDALTQLVEAFLSLRANPLADGLCREGMTRAARSLRRAYANGDDAEARASMSLASLFSGIALANAGLGAVHGFAGPLGGMFSAPHGAICGRLLPAVMTVNLRALEAQESGTGLQRYEEVARILTGKPQACASEGVTWVSQLVADLGVPGLSHHGIVSDDFPAIIERAARAGSMKTNPVPLSVDQMSEVLADAL
jgi:alcohol dehydrogenase class IV